MGRDVASGELEDSGFNVVAFPSADAALPFLRQNSGHLAVVVTDVQMPGSFNGLQMTQILCSMSPMLNILVTSGGPLVNPSRLPQKAKFIAKPWRAVDMVARVQAMAAQAHSA